MLRWKYLKRAMAPSAVQIAFACALAEVLTSSKAKRWYSGVSILKCLRICVASRPISGSSACVPQYGRDNAEAIAVTGKAGDGGDPGCDPGVPRCYDQEFQHRVFFTTSTFTVMSASAKPKMRPCIRPLLMAPLPGLVTAWAWLPAPAACEQHQPRAA